MNLLPVQCASPRCANKAVPGQPRCEIHGGGRGRGWTGTRPMGSGWPKIRAAHLRLEPGCRVCGQPAVTVDHIRPRAFGGTHDEHNLRSLCVIHAHEKNVRDAADGLRRANVRRKLR